MVCSVRDGDRLCCRADMLGCWPPRPSSQHDEGYDLQHLGFHRCHLVRPNMYYDGATRSATVVNMAVTDASLIGLRTCRLVNDRIYTNPRCTASPALTRAFLHVELDWVQTTCVLHCRLTISIIYNSYQKRDSSRSWEKRLQTLARLCCCTDAVSQSKDDRCLIVT